jgi:hypothetical protein
MSLQPLYKSETLFFPMTKYLEDKGFQLVSIERGFVSEETGYLLQVDGIFVKK